ncbi:MAG: Kdo hydroxylase family protein, partial [Acetobacteraceae bacterium]
MTEPNTLTEEDVLEVLSVAAWDTTLGEAERGRAVDALESGRVLFLPFLAFALEDSEKRFLTPSVLAAGSKNVSFDPV